jgi:hypothetical protein
MDEATQHTAKLMDRTARTAQRLEGEARGLLEGVAAFKLSDSDTNKRHPATTARAA